jgi:hypothetical protein
MISPSAIARYTNAGCGGMADWTGVDGIVSGAFILDVKARAHGSRIDMTSIRAVFHAAARWDVAEPGGSRDVAELDGLTYHLLPDGWARSRSVGRGRG